MTQEHGHGNKIWPHRVATTSPDVRKQPADSVPYGDIICTRGKSVWCAYDGDVLIAVTATADEARRKWRSHISGKKCEKSCH